jgi:ribosomal protein S18 acetylase RimI-like enzyme
VLVSLTHPDALTESDALEVWRVHEEVFGDHPDPDDWRTTVWDRHRVRPGFRLVRAHHDGVLAGFAYGQTGEDGQWFTDHARAVLPPELGDAWLGGHFEVVTLGVLPGARRRGTGRTLLRALLDGVPHDRFVLQTDADPTDPARRLYAAEGWHVLGRGIGEGTVIMGRAPGAPG